MKKRTNNSEYKKTLNSIITCSLVHLFTCSLLLPTLPAFAYEDCIISTNGKLTDIKIQHNDVIDVYPLVSISNNKNILIVHPLKVGTTKFSVLKNKKDKAVFTVQIGDKNTVISDVSGYEILSIDNPPKTGEYDFELDEPPVFNQGNYNSKEETIDAIMINPALRNRIDEAVQYHNMIENLDEPPKLRGERSEIAD